MVRVRREKRRGSWNTVLHGVRASHVPGSTDLKPLLKHLRTSLGTGGGLSDAAKGVKLGDDAEIVLQGDHRDTVVGLLKGLGYDAKAAGG